MMKALRNFYFLVSTVGMLTVGASAQGAPLPGHGVLVHLPTGAVASFDARHTIATYQLNPYRDLYLAVANDGRTDAQLLAELATDPVAGRPVLDTPVGLEPTTSSLDGQSTASVLNGQSTASVLNGGTSASNGGLLGSVLSPVLNTAGSVLNPLLGSVLDVTVPLGGTGSSLGPSSSSVLSSLPVTFYGAVVPASYPNQPVVNQIAAGGSAHQVATGRGVVVALIDNGVDPSNPVLATSLLAARGYNFYDNSPDWSAYADVCSGPATGGSGLDGQSTASVLNGQSTASVLNGQSTASVLNGASSAGAAQAALNTLLACDSEFGHGTAVAGLIHLVAPQAMILPIKAFGPGGTADAAAIYQSITYAIDQGANVVNLSFSAPDTTPDVRDAITEAVADGIVVVAAAGNSASSAAVYPASLEGVVGAGALDGTAAGMPRASFSDYDAGPGTPGDVDVAAPGVGLFTTFPGGGQIWATVVGTSFSTPLVAGEAALLAQRQATGAVARQAIENSANPSVGGAATGTLGHGLINVLGALRAIIGSLWLL